MLSRFARLKSSGTLDNESTRPPIQCCKFENEADTETMAKFIELAPQPLVEWYENRTINKGRDILERLVTDPAMNDAWRTLHRKISRPSDWEALFREIVVISSQARRRLTPRSAERDNFRNIARQALELAASVAEGRLDRLAFELFPAQAMRV
jgi:hypothetical protein